MGRFAGALFVVLALNTLSAQDGLPRDRVARVELWLKAVLHHEPGTLDEAAAEIASWSDADLSALWVDLGNLLVLMRNPGVNALAFGTTRPGSKQSTPIYIERDQPERMRILACVAAGIVLTEPACVNRRAAQEIDPDLKQLAAAALDGRGAGADNYVLKRGALMEADIGMAASGSMSPVGPRRVGPQQIQVETTDGQPTSVGERAVHWEIARRLLDGVRRSRADKPSPSADPMVRDWYVATATWMQQTENYDGGHLTHARTLFPRDARILFLSATHHEVYAAPRIQAVVRSAVLPPGFSLEPQSDREELRQAHAFFVDAVAADPGMGEAHLRLGRVLALGAQFADAEREISTALAEIDDNPDRYYANLFLGAVQAATHQDNAARVSFLRAAALFPGAQSPWLALARLAHRRGDRAVALQAMAHVFDDLPEFPDPGADPWWSYDTWQARDGWDLLARVWAPFQSEPQP